MKTFLVSGGAGFIGSHLVDRLIHCGHKLKIVDDLRSSVVVPSIWEDVEVYKETIQYFHHRGSGGERLGGIYHLASPVGPAGILPYAGEIVEDIVSGTYAVIELAQRHHCRLVYVSTSEIYGGGVNGLCSENMACKIDIAQPTARLEYAIGKLAGEIAVLNTPDLDAVIIRPFNVAGPRQSPKGGFVLPRFVQQALLGDIVTVFGNGTQIRAFTHVQDIVDGLLLAMKTGTSKRAYNLGNPANKTTILNLAHKVIDAVGKGHAGFIDGQLIYGPAYAEASDKYPDATRTAEELGWEPKYTIDQTIQDVLEYEKGKLNVNR